MPGIFKLPSITTAQRTGLVLGQRELVFDTDLNAVYRGDGTTAGGLAFAGGAAAWGAITGTLSAQTDLQSALDAKQDDLISGTTLKTVNGTSLLGSGDLVISGGATNLSYTAATRIIASDTGTDATLPLVTTGDAGLAPASGGGTTNFLRADGTWAAPGGGGVSDGDKGDITVTASGATWTIDAQAVTLAKMANIATDSFIGRDTAATGVPEVLSAATARTILNVADGATANSSDATLLARANHTGTQAVGTITGLGTLATQSGTFSGTSSGTNTGDQTSISGITGTKAQFNAAVTDGDILYVGDAPTAHTHVSTDVTDFTEAAQDAVGAMVNTSLIYNDATPSLARAALTGAITASQGGNATLLGSFTKAQLDAAVSDGNVAYAGDAPTAHTHVAADVTDFSAASDARIGAASINALADVIITAPSTGQVVKYNGTNWVNDTDATGGGGSFDFGLQAAMSGLTFY